MSTTEILSIIVIPTAVVLLPLIWGLTGWMIKRSQFLELIFRELEEIGTHPETKERWLEHRNNKRFLHKEIILEESLLGVGLRTLAPQVICLANHAGEHQNVL